MIKLKDILKEELSKGEKFGIKEAATHIVSLHKQLNAALLKFMNGTKKMASNHRKDEVGKDLTDLYKSTKGNYYYATKQAAGKNFAGGSWGKTISKLLGTRSEAQWIHDGKISEEKIKEYRIRGNADSLVISKGDIKKGMMVWFEDGKGRAKKLKVKHVMLSKDKKEEHYVTNKGTFTPRDVVAY